MSRATHRYLALGDSFTIGTGVGPERSFPALLVERWRARGIDVELTDPAVNGYTTDDLIERELPLAARVEPTLVTLLVGANDLVRGSDRPRYAAQLRTILDGLAAAGVPASAIHGLPQPDWSLAPAASRFGDPRDVRVRIEAFNAAMRDEVERAGGRYLDLFSEMRRQAEAGMLAPDGLHPSAEALAEWAEWLETRLLRT
ncbi:MAG TPA: SGNH/GDSL hydrolase family protein [Candidatus Limnocylindria bacterium]|nr:SGNH/GDSL hydrolase family protein [Candidatus Limnocylindria bacterium]